MRLVTVLVLSALAGCAPTVEATAWRQDPARCAYASDWTLSCREGTGVLVWGVWKF